MSKLLVFILAVLGVSSCRKDTTVLHCNPGLPATDTLVIGDYSQARVLQSNIVLHGTAAEQAVHSYDLENDGEIDIVAIHAATDGWKFIGGPFYYVYFGAGSEDSLFMSDAGEDDTIYNYTTYSYSGANPVQAVTTYCMSCTKPSGIPYYIELRDIHKPASPGDKITANSPWEHSSTYNFMEASTEFYQNDTAIDDTVWSTEFVYDVGCTELPFNEAVYYPFKKTGSGKPLMGWIKLTLADREHLIINEIVYQCGLQ